MVRPILVPLDGSDFAEAAMPMAVAVAQRAGARLHLVGVHEPVGTVGVPAGVAPFDEALDRDAMVAESEHLASVGARWAERAGVAVRTELLTGSVASALATYAFDLDVSLIVMTTHGRAGISRAWIGSIADAVVRRARVPVLLIRPARDGKPAVEPSFQASHVLIPLDGSKLSERGIEPAVELGTLYGAQYTLLRIVDSKPAIRVRLDGRTRLAEHVARERAAAERGVEAVAERLRARGFAANAAIAENASAAAGILEYAGTHEVDLIALATRGRGGWARLALGSVADKVMRASRVPALLFRPPAPGTVASSASAAPVPSNE